MRGAAEKRRAWRSTLLSAPTMLWLAVFFVVPIAVIGSEVVGAAGPIGSGHALLFGDEWIEFDSEWSTMPPIPQFWQDAVQWLSPDAAGLPACP